jgi:thiosulfate dehydrogenase
VKFFLLSLALALTACTSSDKKSNSSQADSAARASHMTDSAILAGPMGKSILRGRAILTATHDSLPQNSLNSLRCSSCHLDAGLRRDALSLKGVYARYPQYRARTGAVVTLEARINDCFERSMNGRAISPSSAEMTDLVAYMWFVSRGTPIEAAQPTQGLKKLSAQSGDTLRGQGIFAANCIACHGSNGDGTKVAPPLWGPHSYNIGAGLARPRTAAAFIRYNMPFDRPGVLTDQQAMDVASYINTRVRPDFKAKENDWPKGDPPPDVPYTVKSVAKKTAG